MTPAIRLSNGETKHPDEVKIKDSGWVWTCYGDATDDDWATVLYPERRVEKVIIEAGDNQ